MTQRPLVVWEGVLDERYAVQVTRTAEPYRGTLTLTDTASDALLLSEEVPLSYNAQFGPDVADIDAWQQRCMAVVDARLG